MVHRTATAVRSEACALSFFIRKGVGRAVRARRRGSKKQLTCCKIQFACHSLLTCGPSTSQTKDVQAQVPVLAGPLVAAYSCSHLSEVGVAAVLGYSPGAPERWQDAVALSHGVSCPRILRSPRQDASGRGALQCLPAARPERRHRSPPSPPSGSLSRCPHANPVRQRPRAPWQRESSRKRRT